jgi:parallel beta-helix repeat protein
MQQKELNNPVSQYLRENYGVNSIEEYEAKLEQEIWLNYSKQMQSLASEYPELNLPQNCLQAGTSAYQPPTLKSEPFYAVVLGEPVVSLQVFSLSGLGLLGLTAIPSIKRRKQLRQALILGIVVLCVFSVGYFVGLTVAQTGTITIEPASFSGDYSYLIETDGTYVWAKSGKTGEVAYGGQWNAGGVSGTNATAVIQSAINALTSGGKIVFIGEFSDVNKLSIKNGNITFAGLGFKYSKIISKANVTDLFSFDAPVENVVFKDLYLEINGLDSTSAAIDMDDARNCKVLNCYIKTNYQAISLDGTSRIVQDNEVKGNIFEGTTANSVLIYVLDGVGSIRNIISDNILSLNGGYGIELSGANVYGNLIKNNIINGSGYGIYLYDGPYNNVVAGNFLQGNSYPIMTYPGSRNVISDNIIIDAAGFTGAIHIRGASDENIIDGNIVLNSNWHGIQVEGARNQIISNFVKKSRYHGIYIQGGTRNIISNNFAISNSLVGQGSKDGINLEDATYNRVIGNVCTDVEATKRQRYGIAESGTSDYNYIYDNDLEGNWTGALSVVGVNTEVKRNRGYVTENSGTATVANGEYIAHGIDSSLNIGPTNSTVTVTPYTVTYAGVPVVVGCPFVNGTHIQISAYWTNGTAITNDAIQVWWKVTYP